MGEKKKRYAVVGIGHRSHSWINWMVNQCGDVAELVALCDPATARCDDANRYYDTDAAVFADYDAMLSEAKPDGVIVTSPESVHTRHIVAALDAGCEVATEKPLCRRAEEAVEILEAERRNDRRIFMGFNYRHIPLLSTVREMIVDGRIGRPVSMDLTWYLDYTGHGASYFRRWHRLMEQSGGLLITKATHHFDLANWLMGDDPATVYARCELNFFGPGKGRFKGTRCRECPHADECTFYYDIDDRRRKAEELGYDIKVVRDYAGDTCVFSDDIDIYDTHAVTVQYRGGAVLNYTLNASVPYEGWNMAINGTGGRIETNITDAKPLEGWQRDYKIRRPDGSIDTESHIVEWPDDYTIHLMPHGEVARQVRVPNIAEGHGGGDQRIFDAFFRGFDPSSDRLDIFASAIEGAMSMVIGDAANRSARTGEVMKVDELLGEWAMTNE